MRRLQNAIVDTSLSAHIFKGHMMVNDDGEYYWANPIVWHLSQHYLDFGWLSFNYYGPHLIEIQVADESFRKYGKGFPMGPPQNQYVYRKVILKGAMDYFHQRTLYILLFMSKRMINEKADFYSMSNSDWMWKK